jgi:hypothetical protein
VLILIVSGTAFVLGFEAQVDNGVSDSGDQTYDVISMLGPEAQVHDGVLDSGDKACNDVMFMLNTEAQVTDGVLDSGDQNDVAGYTLDAENQVYCETLVQDAGVQDFDWFEVELTKQLELVCKARLGMEPGRSREDKTVSCVVCVGQIDSTWEADPRHAELEAQELGLTKARPQLSPGGAEAQVGDKAIALETEAKSAYRAATARLSYLASDRPKLLFATNECEEASTCSSRADLTHLKRFGRFLLKEPRCV